MILDQFRRVTLSEASAAAERLLGEARTAADEQRASCEADADRLVAETEADGRDAAARELVAEERLTRRRARQTVLRARSALYQQVRLDAIEALRALRGSPEYARLVKVLESRAVEQLGAGTRCNEAPGEQGGVIAEADARRVAYSLASLVDDELRQRGRRVEGLWA